MNNRITKILALTIFLIFGILFLYIFTSCTNTVVNNESGLQAKVDSLEKALKSMKEEKLTVESNLKHYDSLNMAFNSKDLKKFGQYYAKDIVVNMNNGKQLKGIETLEKDMKDFFENWPSMKAESTILKFGSGDWTVAIDDVTGIFNKPMKIDGKTIQPNGKYISMNFVTFARWKDGKIVEEYDFGNNKLFMQQLGLEK